MSDQQSTTASLLNSIIGEGTRLSGEFDLNGLLRIDGDFLGTIRTTGQIIVGLGGRAKCNIYAESVVVGGVVRGNLFATEKVIILSTGMVLGNISTPRLIVEEGVILSGHCAVRGVEPPAEPQRRPHTVREVEERSYLEQTKGESLSITN